MKKLNQEQQERVEAARKTIMHLQEAQTIIYNNLTKELDWDNDWLYDYMFNCAEDDAYSVHVRSEIFE